MLFRSRDCKRENIWRNEIFPQYKANRANGQEDGFMGGPLFKMAYEEQLFIKGGAKAILSHPKLEADDCIALSVKYISNKYPGCHIYIITSDRDYLQLNADNIDLYNLTYKNIAESKSSTGNAEDDLEIKIIMGDNSDNIPSVFPKCGPKTALKCIENPEFFKKKLDEDLSRIDNIQDLNDYKYKLYTQTHLTNLAKDISYQSYKTEYLSNPYAQMAMEREAQQKQEKAEIVRNKNTLIVLIVFSLKIIKFL